MKELWRKTTNLFLKYPILWLPFVCANLLNDSLRMLGRAADTRILLWLATTTRGSVLGGSPVQIHSNIAPAQIAWISGLTEWSLRYLTACIGTVALVVTAAIVAMIVRGEQPRLRGALSELRNYPKRILGYSFKLYFFDLAFATFVRLTVFSLRHRFIYSFPPTGWDRFAIIAFTQGLLILRLIVFAWIMIPIEIRLLRPPDAGAPTADEKKLGRYFVILTGLGAIALTIALPRLLFSLVALRGFPEEVFSSLASLLWTFPYLLGDIGVALIAAGWNWKLDEAPTQSKLRELARVLMPLHFCQREERW